MGLSEVLIRCKYILYICWLVHFVTFVPDDSTDQHQYKGALVPSSVSIVGETSARVQQPPRRLRLPALSQDRQPCAQCLLSSELLYFDFDFGKLYAKRIYLADPENQNWDAHGCRSFIYGRQPCASQFCTNQLPILILIFRFSGKSKLR